MQRQQMRRCEIEHVNIIPYTASIIRIIVRPEYFNFFPFPACRIQQQRYDMCFGIVVLSYFSFRICPRCIKISEHHEFHTICSMIIFQDPLHHQLRGPVWIYRILRHVFRDRYAFRFPISGTGRRKNNLTASMPPHNFE